jgi:hypothetical protein
MYGQIVLNREGPKLTYMCDTTYILTVKRYFKSGASYPDLEVTLEDLGMPRATLQAISLATLGSGEPSANATPERALALSALRSRN